MADPKTRKKPEPMLDYYVSDIDALEAARPELVSLEKVHRVVTIKGIVTVETATERKFVDRAEKPFLYQLVKLNHRGGHKTPGITIGKKPETPSTELTGNAE